MLTLRSGRYRQLLVAVVKILLREVEAVQFEHLRSNRRCRTVAADHDPSSPSRLLSRFLVAQSYCARLQIVSRAALIEMNGRTVFLGGVYERNIQLRPGN